MSSNQTMSSDFDFDSTTVTTSSEPKTAPLQVASQPSQQSSVQPAVQQPAAQSVQPVVAAAPRQQAAPPKQLTSTIPSGSQAFEASSANTITQAAPVESPPSVQPASSQSNPQSLTSNQSNPPATTPNTQPPETSSDGLSSVQGAPENTGASPSTTGSQAITGGSKHTLDVPTVVGSALGALLIALCIGVFIYKKRSRRSSNQETNPFKSSSPALSYGNSSFSSSPVILTISPPTLDSQTGVPLIPEKPRLEDFFDDESILEYSAAAAPTGRELSNIPPRPDIQFKSAYPNRQEKVTAHQSVYSENLQHKSMYSVESVPTTLASNFSPRP